MAQYEPQKVTVMYLAAQQRYEAVCMEIMHCVADGGSLSEVLEIVGDSMNACDCVDDESIALWDRAKARAETLP